MLMQVQLHRSRDFVVRIVDLVHTELHEVACSKAIFLFCPGLRDTAIFIRVASSAIRAEGNIEDLMDSQRYAATVNASRFGFRHSRHA